MITGLTRPKYTEKTNPADQPIDKAFAQCSVMLPIGNFLTSAKSSQPKQLLALPQFLADTSAYYLCQATLLCRCHQLRDTLSPLK
jgi:hypothetical protein